MKNVRTNMRLVATLTFVTIVAASTPVVTTPARADDCTVLTCSEVCRAELKACLGLRTMLRDWMRSFCKLDAQDATFECLDVKTQADEDCALLCGNEYKSCKKANDNAYDACVESIQPGIALCKSDMRDELSQARDDCQTDSDECNALCGGS